MSSVLGVLHRDNPQKASSLALNVMERAHARGNRDRTLDTILSLFLEQRDYNAALKLLGKDTPITMAYKAMGFARFITIGAGVEVAYHKALYPMTGIYMAEIPYILTYPPSQLREKTYYIALERYVSQYGPMSEVEFLRSIPRDHLHYDLIKERLDAILSLFPNEDVTFEHEGCQNDYGITDDPSQVPDMYMYKVTHGERTYCFSVGELFGLLSNPPTGITNPYTRESVSTDKVREITRYMYSLARDGYPIMKSTVSDFYDPIEPNPELIEGTDRYENMLEELRLRMYTPELRGASRMFNVQPFAFQHIPMFIRYFGTSPDIGKVIHMAYPEVARTIDDIIYNILP